jgi:hypothetical protein
MVLLIIGGLFTGGFAWLARTSRIGQTPRILAGASPGRSA